MLSENNRKSRRSELQKKKKQTALPLPGVNSGEIRYDRTDEAASDQGFLPGARVRLPSLCHSFMCVLKTVETLNESQSSQERQQRQNVAPTLRS